MIQSLLPMQFNRLLAWVLQNRCYVEKREDLGVYSSVFIERIRSRALASYFIRGLRGLLYQIPNLNTKDIMMPIQSLLDYVATRL